MTSDVVLAAAMRTNLLSLQKTQNSIDITQNRLATGKKVNSALDGPQAFFASQALTNRAGDLTKLLDSIGQSIQVIKAADNGITALTKLVEQADSIANQAQEALAAGTAEAKVVGNRDLRNIDNLSTVAGVTAGSTLTLSATNDEGNLIDLDPTVGVQTTLAVTISGNSTNEVITAINEIRNQTDNSQVFEAKLNEKGQLEIRTLNGGNFTADFTTTTNSNAEKLGLASALGFSEIAKVTADGIAAAPDNVGFSAVSDVALKSYAFVKNASGDVADRSTLLTDLRDAKVPGTNTFVGLSGENYTIAVNGGTAQNIAMAATMTIQGFIDTINNNSTLNTKIEASFDETTGQVSISAIDASVKSVQIGFAGSAIGDAANFGFGLTPLTALANGVAVEENISLGAAAGQLAKLEQDFGKVMDQIDLLVKDTGYRGTNLLNGNDLLTVFNEDRTSTITTKGVTFTADGLGIEEADFSNVAAVTGALAQVRDALTAVREFGSSLANDLSVIQTRETFTKELINTLTEGSDKLVNADQNEEGAKLLALQTRQSLGVTSLSLASQSQQSILRLF